MAKVTRTPGSREEGSGVLICASRLYSSNLASTGSYLVKVSFTFQWYCMLRNKLLACEPCVDNLHQTVGG